MEKEENHESDGTLEKRKGLVQDTYCLGSVGADLYPAFQDKLVDLLLYRNVFRKDCGIGWNVL